MSLEYRMLETLRRSISTVLLANLFFVLVVTPAFAADEWFKSAPGGCTAPAAFSTNLLKSLGLTVPDEFKGNGNALYIRVKRSALAPLQTSTYAVLQRKVTTDSDRKLIKQAITSQMEMTEVPFTIGEMGAASIGGLIGNFSGGGAVAGSALWDYFVNKVNARTDVLKTFSSLTTEGGALAYVLGLKYASGVGNLLYISQEYQIQVGQESAPRSYIMRACLYPYEVLVDKFETKAPSGNKVVTRTDEVTFKVWDVEDARYDNYTLSYKGQDIDYYYFQRDADTQYRISMWGGLWQSRHEGSANWGTLYTKVDSE